MFYPFLSIRVSSVSEKFQKNMNQILQALEGLECSIDDVLVHGKNQEEYDERLEAVLKRLVEAGVTFNLDYCNFLRHVISSRGIEADTDKLQAIPDLPPPQNVQEVRTFLGMVK